MQILVRLRPSIAILLTGCISMNTPGDLAFTSVEVVDLHDQAELPGPGASPILGMVSDRDLLERGQSITGGPKRHLLLLKAKFTSKTNLSKFVRDSSYSLGGYAYFCDHEKTSPQLSLVHVFWNGHRLGAYEADPIEKHTQSLELVTYYIFVKISDTERPRDIPPQEGYDLRQKPVDVCVYVRGGNNWGRGYRSSTAVIPKEAIAASLQNAPPGIDG